jgi:hypothetical protein
MVPRLREDIMVQPMPTPPTANTLKPPPDSHGVLSPACPPAGDAEVRAEVGRHYRWVSRFWTPDAEAYRNLGRMYVDDERFRANYEKITEGLAAYQRDAMAVYAAERLS